MIHFARIENSERLQRFVAFLGDGQWHSTREIVHGAEVMAVNSCATEVRRNGIPVEHEQRGRHHYYRIPKGQRELFAA